MPSIVSAVIVSGSVLLLLVMVLIFAVLRVFRLSLPKSSNAGAMLGAATTADVPVPVRLRVCWEFGTSPASSTTLIVAVLANADAEFGVNVTSIVQLEPAGT